MKAKLFVLAVAALMSALSLRAQTAACTLTQVTGQTTHKVVLNWGASATSGVGYNVYRAAGICASATSCTFTKIQGSINGSVLTYTDSTVTQGNSFSYYVTAYDTTGALTESGPSNVCSGTVPTGGSTGNGQTAPPGTVSGTIQ